jgi:hypothetical protein
MYEEIYEPSPNLYWVKLNSRQNKSARRQWRKDESMFTCKRCQAAVPTEPSISGVLNRNHCPYCLWSRHVDYLQPGDRMSACKAIMQPIGLTLKRRKNKYGEWEFGELMVIHCCNDCGKISINRIAADDQVERLMELFSESLSLSVNTLNQLESNGIEILHAEHAKLVTCQLQGVCQH